MASANREGVIKFQLDFQAGPPPPAADLYELNAWREIFRRLGMIGQNPARYDGFGFGNLSRRLPGQRSDTFLISGTQTGHLPSLRPEDYATVLHCDPAANHLKAAGRIKPSSEALSHGILYQSSPQILWVMHLHSPEIFNCRRQLMLPCTDHAAAYGTPEMAAEIQRLAATQEQPGSGLLVMTGHQDGLLAYGSTAEEAGNLVVGALVAALQQS